MVLHIALCIRLMKYYGWLLQWTNPVLVNVFPAYCPDYQFNLALSFKPEFNQQYNAASKSIALQQVCFLTAFSPNEEHSSSSLFLELCATTSSRDSQISSI
ncbi:hypothetical protein AABB24_027875 [Solanum stoloniferum]|uniref:Uncharacterized protein n=1 Tax=Solanum stoloniferum TaxID=62892 RepID=A0ABD2S450_9SOLN